MNYYVLQRVFTEMLTFRRLAVGFLGFPDVGTTRGRFVGGGSREYASVC